MKRWQTIFLGFVFFAVALVMVVRIGENRTEEHKTAEKLARWTPTTGTITGTRKVPVFKGMGTSVQGQYIVSGETHSFDYFWGRDEWTGTQWRSPDNTPAVGAPICLFYDPHHPAVSLPDVPPRSWIPDVIQLFVLGAVLLLALLCWFVLPRVREPRAVRKVSHRK